MKNPSIVQTLKFDQHVEATVLKMITKESGGNDETNSKEAKLTGGAPWQDLSTIQIAPILV
jgi:hypothetical protein